MEKKQLMESCDNLLKDIQNEMEKQNFEEAIPLLQDFFKQLQRLEDDVDVFWDDQEFILETILTELSRIDTEKLKDIKEIIGMLDNVEKYIEELKSYLFFGRTEEIMQLLWEIRWQLSVISMKI